jgi:hypothetical protein
MVKRGPKLRRWCEGALLFLLLIGLVAGYYILRPQGNSWAECTTPKGIVCVPKVP